LLWISITLPEPSIIIPYKLPLNHLKLGFPYIIPYRNPISIPLQIPEKFGPPGPGEELEAVDEDVVLEDNKDRDAVGVMTYI